jgi:hypothetical protein
MSVINMNMEKKQEKEQTEQSIPDKLENNENKAYSLFYMEHPQ